VALANLRYINALNNNNNNNNLLQKLQKSLHLSITNPSSYITLPPHLTQAQPHFRDNGAKSRDFSPMHKQEPEVS